jgi:hypothetical protein
MKIPIKKYVMDESLPWEERYRQLEAHHEEETKFLIGHCNELEKSRVIPVDWIRQCAIQVSDSEDGNFRRQTNIDLLARELEKLGFVIESHPRSDCPRLSVRGCGRCRELTGDSY